jgi:uncharacterized low-complexity protein
MQHHYRKGYTMNNKKLKPIAAALGAAFLASAIVPVAAAETVNPFAATQMSSGYDLANFAHHGDKAKGEGKCGEGKCGGDKIAEGEGSCGGDKAEGEGSCGGDKAEGEGSCGGDKAEGEGSCGGDKAEKAEGKCGEGKCGAK